MSPFKTPLEAQQARANIVNKLVPQPDDQYGNTENQNQIILNGLKK